MAHRTKILELDLSKPIETLTDLGGYNTLQLLVKLHGQPIDWIWLGINGDRCSASAIAQAMFPHLQEKIAQALLTNRLLQPGKPWDMPSLLTLSTPQSLAKLTTLTIALCIDMSMDRAEDVELSIQALGKLQQPIVIVEALPADDRAKTWTKIANLQYISTTNPGRNAARNAAIDQATTEAIAFIQPGGIPTVQWAEAITSAFSEDPNLKALTGLVIPEVIDRESQAVLDRSYSPGRGLNRKTYSIVDAPKWMDLGTMQVGSGLNMAFRRGVFDSIGRFDPALNLPGLTWGGGEWDLFARLLLAGEKILYAPKVTLATRFLIEDGEIRSHLHHNMTAFYSYLEAGRNRFPQAPWSKLATWKSAWLGLALIRSWGVPRHWIAAEIKGAMAGRKQYRQALSRINALPPNPGLRTQVRSLKPMAVQELDLDQGLQAITNASDYETLRLYVRQGSRPIGCIAIDHQGQSVSPNQLAEAIAQQLHKCLLAIPYGHNHDQAWSQAQIALENHWRPQLEPIPNRSNYSPLDQRIPVSIIITTCDRPEDLRRCLTNLIQQKTDRSVEIIVADNRPASGLTKPVVSEFAAVRYVPEARAGGSYGRNAAFVASTGDIVVTVDDDVTVPLDWLEKLIAPMVRPEVMVVTGNVLPLELETPAQVMFETLKGGLGEGFVPFEADRGWLDSFTDRSPPTWDLGVSANAAFRSSIFHHPQIGMMDEVLGPGTPTVGGEENHLVYKVLRAGYKVVYHPEAYAWHRHRREMKAFYKQVYGHMKGGTAYHLLLWLQEKDNRGRDQILIQMPLYLKDYFRDRLLQKHKTPWRLMWSELTGYIAGFWGYKQSVDRVKHLGRSAPYIPPKDRPPGQSITELPTQAETLF
jgi:O-antigen biosynthesis protein